MKRSERLYLIMTMMLVTVIFFTAAQTVHSQSSDRQRRQYYAVMEKEYIADIRNILADEGYEYGGVTLRRMDEADDLRKYTVLIHHKKINMLDDFEKKELADRLSKAEFCDDSCAFSYEFILP